MADKVAITNSPPLVTAHCPLVTNPLGYPCHAPKIASGVQVAPP